MITMIKRSSIDLLINGLSAGDFWLTAMADIGLIPIDQLYIDTQFVFHRWTERTELWAREINADDRWRVARCARSKQSSLAFGSEHALKKDDEIKFPHTYHYLILYNYHEHPT